MATKYRKQATTKRGRRGATGMRGPAGMRGARGIAPEALKTVIRHMEKLQADAAIQFTRTAQIQMQVDKTLLALKEMGESAGRQRKKR